MKKNILPLFLIISVSTQAQLGGLLNKVKSKMEVTSSIHKKNMNKIVFASTSESLNKGNEVESDFKTEFNLGDLIYFRAYFEDNLIDCISPLVKESKEALLENATFRFDFYIDDVLVENLTNNNVPKHTFRPDEKENWTTFKGAFKSEHENDDMVGKNAFKDLLRKQTSKLTPGKHQLKVEISPIYIDSKDATKNAKGKVISTGSITLNVKEVNVDPNDPLVCIPKSNMTDAALEAKIAKYYLQNFKNKCDVIRIQSSNWAIEKNKYTDGIVRRKLDVYIGSKNEDSGCYRQLFTVLQEYTGGKYNEELTFQENLRYLPVEINCKCLTTKTK